MKQWSDETIVRSIRMQFNFEYVYIRFIFEIANKSAILIKTNSMLPPVSMTVPSQHHEPPIRQSGFNALAISNQFLIYQLMYLCLRRNLAFTLPNTFETM